MWRGLDNDPAVCRNCFFVIDRDRWHQDAGRPAPDPRDRDHELKDPPIETPVAQGAEDLSGGLAGAFRLAGLGKILWRRRR